LVILYGKAGKPWLDYILSHISLSFYILDKFMPFPLVLWLSQNW
jgi:hypothetical protein